MIPAQIDFLFRTNADYGEELAFTEDEQPLDLTGMSFAMQVRCFPGGPLLFNVPIGVLEPTQGTASIGVSKETLAEIGALSIASHDIIVTYADGFTEPWGQGCVTIEQGVTQNG